MSREAPRCAVWGVLNVTPDSFSDGGRFLRADKALEHARRMVAEGANVIDVGGESSRPAGRVYGTGARPVTEQEEIDRVCPVVEAIVRDLPVAVSVDTVKPAVARAALAAGARVVNDVSCGADPDLIGVAAAHGAELVLMHNRGRGKVSGDNVRYDDVVADVVRELGAAAARALEAGVRREDVWIDPGIGFAKTADQSVRLLARTGALVDTGYRVLVGPSRKSFIAALAPRRGEPPPPSERLGGTAAAVTLAVLGGAHAVRVHDVAVMAQAVRVAEAGRMP